MTNPLASLIYMLIVLLVAGVIRWAAQKIVTAAGLPALVGTVVDVAIVVVLVLWALRFLGLA